MSLEKFCHPLGFPGHDFVFVIHDFFHRVQYSACIASDAQQYTKHNVCVLIRMVYHLFQIFSQCIMIQAEELSVHLPKQILWSWSVITARICTWGDFQKSTHRYFVCHYAPGTLTWPNHLMCSVALAYRWAIHRSSTAATDTVECVACDEACALCTGPGSENCTACKWVVDVHIDDELCERRQVSVYAHCTMPL